MALLVWGLFLFSGQCFAGVCSQFYDNPEIEKRNSPPKNSRIKALEKSFGDLLSPERAYNLKVEISDWVQGLRGLKLMSRPRPTYDVLWSWLRYTKGGFQNDPSMNWVRSWVLANFAERVFRQVDQRVSDLGKQKYNPPKETYSHPKRENKIYVLAARLLALGISEEAARGLMTGATRELPVRMNFSLPDQFTRELFVERLNVQSVGLGQAFPERNLQGREGGRVPFLKWKIVDLHRAMIRGEVEDFPRSFMYGFSCLFTAIRVSEEMLDKAHEDRIHAASEEAWGFFIESLEETAAALPGEVPERIWDLPE